MLNRIKKEFGSITIEATISLSAFMFAIVTILTIVNICVIQARMSTAINAAAKELSQYSYLYALTHINESHAKISEAAGQTEMDIDKTIQDTNDVFTCIQNLKKDASDQSGSEDLSATLEQLGKDAQSMKNSGIAVKSDIEKLASDPKKLAIGLAKIAGNDGLNFALSKGVAAPLAKVLCQKNLVSQRGGDVDSYLKQLGVKPGASGSYIDGLDFSDSTLFPDGSNEIRISVAYDVKVIALLPIDFSFHFHQSAVTQGWMAGDKGYRTTKELLEATENDSIWTKGTIAERSELIRHQGIADLKDEGYYKTKGLTDVQLYNPDINEFVSIHSMNPLYSAPGEDTLTLDDISDEAIQMQLQQLCGSINSTVDRCNEVTYEEKDKDGKNKTKDCTGASKKIIIVVPEDEGVQERIQSIANNMDTQGVEIVVQKSYGKGARTSTDGGNAQ